MAQRGGLTSDEQRLLRPSAGPVASLAMPAPQRQFARRVCMGGGFAPVAWTYRAPVVPYVAVTAVYVESADDVPPPPPPPPPRSASTRRRRAVRPQSASAATHTEVHGEWPAQRPLSATTRNAMGSASHTPHAPHAQLHASTATTTATAMLVDAAAVHSAPDSRPQTPAAAQPSTVHVAVLDIGAEEEFTTLLPLRPRTAPASRSLRSSVGGARRPSSPLSFARYSGGGMPSPIVRSAVGGGGGAFPHPVQGGQARETLAAWARMALATGGPPAPPPSTSLQ